MQERGSLPDIGTCPELYSKYVEGALQFITLQKVIQSQRKQASILTIIQAMAQVAVDRRDDIKQGCRT
jgi:hypothetical protein